MFDKDFERDVFYFEVVPWILFLLYVELLSPFFGFLMHLGKDTLIK